MYNDGRSLVLRQARSISSCFEETSLTDRLTKDVLRFPRNRSHRRLTPITVGNGICAAALPPNTAFQADRS